MLVFLAALGCDAEVQPPATFAEDLATFRAATEAEIGAPTGPLAAVASHYVAPGHALVLAPRGDRVVAGPGEDPDAPGAVRLAVDEDGIECTRGCGPTPVRIEAAREVQMGAHVLGLSPQSGGLRVLVHDPSSPARAAFQGLRWAAPDPRWWRQGRLVPASDVKAEPLATRRGLTKSMRLAGVLKVALPGGDDVELRAYEAGPGELLVPFTDASNGAATYDAGRYLTLHVSSPDFVVVDFNRATNPWCAQSEHYNCPIPPAGNHVSVDVVAGELHGHGLRGH